MDSFCLKVDTKRYRRIQLILIFYKGFISNFIWKNGLKSINIWENGWSKSLAWYIRIPIVSSVLKRAQTDSSCIKMNTNGYRQTHIILDYYIHLFCKQTLYIHIWWKQIHICIRFKKRIEKKLCLIKTGTYCLYCFKTDKNGFLLHKNG